MKKITLACLTLVMLLSVSACSNGNATSSTPTVSETLPESLKAFVEVFESKGAIILYGGDFKSELPTAENAALADLFKKAFTDGNFSEIGESDLVGAMQYLVKVGSGNILYLYGNGTYKLAYNGQRSFGSCDEFTAIVEAITGTIDTLNVAE